MIAYWFLIVISLLAVLSTEANNFALFPGRASISSSTCNTSNTRLIFHDDFTGGADSFGMVGTDATAANPVIEGDSSNYYQQMTSCGDQGFVFTGSGDLVVGVDFSNNFAEQDYSLYADYFNANPGLHTPLSVTMFFYIDASSFAIAAEFAIDIFRNTIFFAVYNNIRLAADDPSASGEVFFSGGYKGDVVDSSNEVLTRDEVTSISSIEMSYTDGKVTATILGMTRSYVSTLSGFPLLEVTIVTFHISGLGLGTDTFTFRSVSYRSIVTCSTSNTRAFFYDDFTGEIGGGDSVGLIGSDGTAADPAIDSNNFQQMTPCGGEGFVFTGSGDLDVGVDFANFPAVQYYSSIEDIFNANPGLHTPLSVTMGFYIDESTPLVGIDESTPLVGMIAAEFAIDIFRNTTFYAVYNNIRLAADDPSGSGEVFLGGAYKGDVVDSSNEVLTRDEVRSISSIAMFYTDGKVTATILGMTRSYVSTLSVDLSQTLRVTFLILGIAYVSDTFTFTSVSYRSDTVAPSSAPSAFSVAPSTSPTPAPTPAPLAFSVAPSTAPTPAPSAFSVVPSTGPTLAPTPAPSDLVDCFSALTTAFVYRKGSVTMDLIEVGDKVLTGSGEFQTVYTVNHHDAKKSAEFLQIAYGSNILEVTPKHMIFVERKQYPVASGTVIIGDKVATPNGYETVISIDLVMRKGVFNPLTADGTIVASGLIASTFSALLKDQNDSINISGHAFMSYQDFFKSLMKPYRLFCTSFSLELCRSESDLNIASKVATRVFFLHNSEDNLYQMLLLSLVALLVSLMETILLPLFYVSVLVGFIKLANIWRK